MILPFSRRTCCSLIHALRILRIVLLARVIPPVIASSKLFVEVELISVTFATDICTSLVAATERTASPMLTRDGVPPTSELQTPTFELRTPNFELAATSSADDFCGRPLQ